MNATPGHPVIINFSTILQWIIKTPKPLAFPRDPDQAVWNYEQGAELRDPSMKEVAGYYGRLASWTTRGGFGVAIVTFPRSSDRLSGPRRRRQASTEVPPASNPGQIYRYNPTQSGDAPFSSRV